MRTSKTKKWVLIIGGIGTGICLGVIVILVLLAFRYGPGQLAAFKTPLVGLEVNSPAPEFELVNLAGKSVRLSDLRGKPVVINFWATWCGPCVREMPLFQSYQDRYPEFVMLGINEEESPKKVQDFMEKLNLDYEILLDQDTKVAALYKVMILPSTFFIDEEGMIRYSHLGYMSEEQFKYYLAELGILD